MGNRYWITHLFELDILIQINYVGLFLTDLYLFYSESITVYHLVSLIFHFPFKLSQVTDDFWVVGGR